MRLRLCFALLLIGVGSLACSSKSSKPKANNQPQSTGTDTGTGTDTNTNTDAGDPDAGGTGVSTTADCPAWPAEKLAPIIGPFFYGTDPRPCRIEIGNTYLFFAWVAGTQHLDTMKNVAGPETTQYEYDADGLLVDAVKTHGTQKATTMYKYAADSTTWTTTDYTGAVTTTVYKLGAQGYPTEVTIDPAPSGQPVRYVHEYENCQLMKRVAYDAGGAVNNDQTADYYYDDQGRVIERKATGDDEVFVYDTGC